MSEPRTTNSRTPWILRALGWPPYRRRVKRYDFLEVTYAWDYFYE